MSTTVHLIKVTNTACPDLEGSRDTGNTKDLSKTGKITAVFAFMNILSRRIQGKVLKLLKSKSLAPDRAKKKLKMAKHCLTRAKMHEKDNSKKLIVKNKTIRVLLDSGLSGDLLFIKKRGF